MTLWRSLVAGLVDGHQSNHSRQRYTQPWDITQSPPNLLWLMFGSTRFMDSPRLLSAIALYAFNIVVGIDQTGWIWPLSPWPLVTFWHYVLSTFQNSPSLLQTGVGSELQRDCERPFLVIVNPLTYGCRLISPNAISPKLFSWLADQQQRLALSFFCLFDKLVEALLIHSRAQLANRFQLKQIWAEQWTFNPNIQLNTIKAFTKYWEIIL